MTPRFRHCLAVICAIWIWGEVGNASIWAQANRPRALSKVTTLVEPSPLQDDATLHAITFVGSRFGCAVGDRGACWLTRDGGISWSFSQTSVSCTLRGVHFLTDKIGWAVGGEVAPYTRFASGTVIRTVDGGQSWQVVSQKQTPPLSQVRFVDEEIGLAIGEASPNCPTGVLTTSDGGKSWNPSTGPRANGWLTGALLPNGSGIVAGARGELGVLNHGALLRQVETLKGLRGIQDVILGTDSTGWLVGDGGLVQRTRNNGISWEPPAGQLPMELRECMDFHAVAQSGERVWIAGAPGSVIWHSPDGGRQWTRQNTSETTPLHDLYFLDENHGMAVGDLGKILMTHDGGENWQTVRGQGRHLALLTIHAQPEQIPFGSLAYFSGEWGYRSATLLMTRRDVGEHALLHIHDENRMRDAVSAVGGSQATMDWRLPLTVPALDRNKEKLVEEWLLLTDQKLPQIVTTDLAAKIRMWQPEVILVSQPVGDDATGQVVWDAVQQAVKFAGTDASLQAIETHTGLTSWSVKKVMSHSFQEKGTQNILPTQSLDRARLTVDQLTEPAASRMLDRSLVSNRNEGLTLVSSSLGDSEVIRQTVFGGIDLPAGGPSRRKLAAVSIEGLKEQQLAIEKRQNFRSYSTRLMDSRPAQSSSLIAQLRELVAGMPPEQGAKLLSDAAHDYRDRMLWEPAEEAHALILDMYPDHPAADESALWLLHLWTSEEVAWQRLRKLQSNRMEVTTNSAILQAQFQSQLQTNRRDPNRLSSPIQDADPQSGVVQSKSPLPVVPGDLAALASGQTVGADVLALQADQWRQRAAKVAQLVEQTSPGFFQQPDVQLTVASLMRRIGKPTDGDRILDQLLKLDSNDAWSQIAMGELWLLRPQAQSPRPVATCRRTSLAPRLDGVLNDACWEGAVEIPLTDRPTHAGDNGFVGTKTLGAGSVQIAGPKSLVKLMYDDRFMYIAASLPRMEGLSNDPPQHGGRTHDADLELHDHLNLKFDTDRDYSTAYSFSIDQRGWTREACWDATKWNPQWYVAAFGDDRVWRFEAAIPWEEIAAQAPQPGASWAAGITRVLPTVGLQGWTHPLSESPVPQAFGLVRFE